MAVYLVSLERYEEAKNVLDQFVFKVAFDSRRLDLWGSNGLVIRAYIAELEGDAEAQLRCIRLVQHNDIISDERDKEEMLLEDLENYRQELEYILGETPKWKCEGMAISAMIMTHYKLMIRAGVYDIESVDVTELQEIIDYCYSTLRDALC